MNTVDQVVANLRKWRPLPGYSVERRIDALLTPFLEGFLSAKMGATVELVTAEFPIAKALFAEQLGKSGTATQHIQADFLCVRRGAKPAFILVELKTDASSKGSGQYDAYVEVAAHHSMKAVLAALLEAKANTPHESEYRRIAAKVRLAARGAEKIEVCYVEPIVGEVPEHAEASCRCKGAARAPVWRFGLGKLARHIPATDPFGRMLQKLLRGIARSDKAMRPSVPKRAA